MPVHPGLRPANCTLRSGVLRQLHQSLLTFNSRGSLTLVHPSFEYEAISFPVNNFSELVERGRGRAAQAPTTRKCAAA